MGKSAERMLLGFADLDIEVGSHIAYVYGSEDERQGCLLGYISAGLRNGERCIIAIPEYTSDFLVEGLRSQGINADSLPEGQLDILTALQLLPDYDLEPARSAISALSESIASSSDSQWRSTRVFTSFSDLYHQEISAAELLKAESETNYASRNKALTFMCAFSSTHLNPRTMKACLQCHPYVTNGVSLTSNNEYLSPDRMTAALPDILKALITSGAMISPLAYPTFYYGVPFMHINGELDIHTVSHLQELADRLVSIGHKNLVLDLSEATFMDAASISAIIKTALSLRAREGKLVIYEPSDTPRKILALTRIGEVIPIHRECDEAIRATADNA